MLAENNVTSHADESTVGADLESDVFVSGDELECNAELKVQQRTVFSE